MSLTLTPHDDEILSGLSSPMTPAAAESLLKLTFSDGQQRRMSELAEKARAGELTDKEHAEAESFERISSLLGVIHSQARRTLNSASA